MESKQNNEWLLNISGKPNEFLGKYLVHDDERILFSNNSVRVANQWLKDHLTEYTNLSCFYLSKNFFNKRILSVRVKSLKNAIWIPQKHITFLGIDKPDINIDILVDSGADSTFLPFQFGSELGLIQHKDDLVKEAFGVGSTIKYIEKAIKINLDGTILLIPVCWCLNPTIDDLLFGREGIYEHYRVIFDKEVQDVIFQPFEEI